jgi:Holliday junction resolvase
MVIKNISGLEHLTLTGLVSDPTEIKKLYRVKNNQFEFKSIHPADEEEYLSKGWEIQRAGKRSSRIKKTKSHDVLLEDKMWCFLYRMGYTHFSGNAFEIHYLRDDDSVGKKQIDAFAYDGETAIVVECKSRNDRGRRSLQKDLHETIYLQEKVKRTINSLQPSNPNTKVIWIYATNNIIWSEPDVERATSGKITIITENETQYHCCPVKHRSAPTAVNS